MKCKSFFLETMSSLLLPIPHVGLYQWRSGIRLQERKGSGASFLYYSLYGPVNLHDIYFRFHVEFQQYEETRRLLICLFVRVLVNPAVSSNRKGNEIARNRVETRFSNSFFRFRAFRASGLVSV